MRSFKGKRFKKDIILVAVGYYCRFSLSYRDVSEILKECGVSVHPTTIMRWVHEYGNPIYQMRKKKNKSAHHALHLDETYIKVEEEWCYLYHAIDSDGHTLDFQLRKTRNHQAAYSFMKRLIKQFGEPSVLMCIRNIALKHLNNLIEQDHRHIKRRFVQSAGFQSLRHASRTLKGIETIHAIYKQKRSHMPDFSFSPYNELQQLFTTA
ncbi:IS6 family transposase [Bacillus cereus]|uniref:IS6 family transposase n=1 Tax=Bacillus cereus TaxID=1396 RepID=UPI001F5B85BC|nr:IS6 family transposase [Bacillus cereus]